MPNNFGINVNISSKATRKISQDTETIILIAGTIDRENGASVLKEHKNSKKALEHFTGKQGSIIEALKDIEMQNAGSKIFTSTGKTITSAIEKIKDIKKEFGIKPNIIVATPSSLTNDQSSVNAKMQEVVGKLGGGIIAIIDLKASSISDAKNEISSLDSKRLFPVFQSGCIVNRKDSAGNYIMRPMSAIVAGAIARKDGESKFGYAKSPSMTKLNGIIKGGVEFENGMASEGDELRTKGINSVINYSGFRLWGDCTLSSDPIWKDLKRLRIFDKVEEAFLKGLSFVIDKNAASSLIYIQESVESYLRNLKGAGVLSGSSFEWDPEENTKENVLNGRFFLNVEAQEMPSVKKLEINLIHSDEFSDSIIKVA